ncbi:hypothetical protein VQ643_09590 [Pseudomonas sp. F1_0610]|uniref:hypothetical protein n=1 Tax=Pseudomonas sp. F1_0610 TaxID=3114284 RepID=UPI0039C28E04
MKLQGMISALQKTGMSQSEIARQIGTNQPTINRASKGRQVFYSVGRKIEMLYLEQVLEKEDPLKVA